MRSNKFPKTLEVTFHSENDGSQWFGASEDECDRLSVDEETEVATYTLSKIEKKILVSTVVTSRD
jgi:hypothetical protein